ncbi:MAG: site-specific integrase [Planctomycetes bacterium]|nr:site-specific integrase [Planctomycetota bacterium]
MRLLFADQPAKEFGPACLETVRNHMIEEGLARSVINQRIGVVKRMFRWAERKEMVPRGTFHNLATLEALKAGRSRARETAEVEPVSWENVAATLPYLPPSVRAMVQVQQLTGMRPGEVVTMRTVDIDRSESDWIYRPPQHKTKHRGIAREVPLLEKVQAILKPLIEQKTEFLFVPEGRIARAKRYTTTTYAQAIRRGAAAASAPERHEAILATIPADVRKFFEKQVRRLWKHMSPKRLARVIERIAKRKKLAPGPLVDKAVAALEKHVDKVPAWSPNQLRHAAATRIVNNSRLEDARVVLGHTDMRTTLRYVKPDLKRAIDAMRKLG